MKKSFRSTALLLASITVLTLFLSACGQSVELMDFLPEDSDDSDLFGYEFTIADRSSVEDTTLISYKENTVLYDALVARIAEVEEEYNCGIEFDILNYDFPTAMARMMSDSFDYEAIVSNHGDMQDLARGNFLVPASDYLEFVDLLNYEKYGTPSIQECNSYKGDIYMLSPQSWLYMQPSALDLMIFNMNLVSKYGKGDPGEHIENGTWTWDALEDVISDYYVNEGENVVYSIATRPFDLVKLLCIGNGVSFTYRDEDGNLCSDFGQPNMMEALDFYARVCRENGEKFALNLLVDSDWDEVRDEFISETSMCCITAAWMLYEEIAYKVENYSVMPFPTGPSGEYGKWPSIVEGMAGFSVYSGNDDPEIAFRLLDAICEPLDGYETEADRLAYLQTEVFYDDFDASVALNTHKNGTYSYWKGEIGSFQPDTLWREMARCFKDFTASEVLSKYKSQFDSVITEYMTPNLAIYDILN